jgi:hypothetical protein
MIFVLLVIFQIKHFLADYPLQTPYMLKKFLGGRDWIMPLACHAGVHALFTLLIALAVKPEVAFLVAGLDFTLHFIMDRIKASPNMLGKYKALNATTYKHAKYMSEGLSMVDGTSLDVPESELVAYKEIGRNDLKSNTYFWWSLGLDQSVHHLTHYLIIWILL